MSTAEQLLTPDDLLTMPDGSAYEFVDGHAMERVMDAKAVWVAGQIHHLLQKFLDEHRTGWAFADGVQLRCYPDDPDRVRKPDACFIRQGRLQPDEPPEGFILIAPDLVVEVVSPTDYYYEVERKVEEYLEAGVLVVWVINPDTRTVKVYTHDRAVSQLDERQELSGADVLPGFRCTVSELFPPSATDSSDAKL